MNFQRCEHENMDLARIGMKYGIYKYVQCRMKGRHNLFDRAYCHQHWVMEARKFAKAVVLLTNALEEI